MEKSTWENIDDQFTIDGHKIVPGLKVWDYNYSAELHDADKSEVIEPEPYGNPAEGVWFITERPGGRRGIFDGGRMWVNRPW
jgi:hypothetical protein